MHKAIIILKKIPKGKVSTYKILAEKTGTSPRAIGAIMRSNQHPKDYPCYKIVKSSGEISGYGGSDPKKIQEKIMLLKKDGIEIKDGKIDLNKYLYKFS